MSPPERAADLLTEALGLWRGPALADFAAEPFAEAEAARWEELRLCCAQDRVEAALALGRHGAVVADLEQMVRVHPLRERLRGQLMLALYRAGRQSQALAVYQEFRRVLDDELGLGPGAALKAMEQAILRQDRVLDWNPGQFGAGRGSGPLDGRGGADGSDDAGRVLVVDDSSVNRRLLVSALQKLGHEVHTAENGQRALEQVHADLGFDVVLLDLLMPVMDGFTTLQAIKQDAALRHLPVIMISAVHEQESVIRCIELGATDYLPKPFSAVVLHARLRASLAAKRLRDVELQYLRQVDEVLDTAGARDEGSRLAREAARDDGVGRLARKFQLMSREVEAREEALRREIAELRAQIDGDRRPQEPASG